MWPELHQGNVIPGGYLPGILHKEANCTTVSIGSRHVFFESASGEMNGSIVNLKASYWESPVKDTRFCSVHVGRALEQHLLAL